MAAELSSSVGFGGGGPAVTTYRFGVFGSVCGANAWWMFGT